MPAKTKTMKKTASALDISAYFVHLANNQNESDLTNLKLQKLLYFAQGEYLAKTGSPLFKDPIEAWDLGPVVRTVYDTFKECGPFPITTFDINVGANLDELPNDVKKFVETVWDDYGKYSARFLVDETHREGSPWQKAHALGGNSVIETKHLISHFANN